MPEPCQQPPEFTQSLEILNEDTEIIEEPVKTFLSFLWLWSGFFATSTSLALTHEKVPDTAPLPDLVLDNIRSGGTFIKNGIWINLNSYGNLK